MQIHPTDAEQQMIIDIHEITGISITEIIGLWAANDGSFKRYHKKALKT